jgi:hypothetical protein
VAANWIREVGGKIYRAEVPRGTGRGDRARTDPQSQPGDSPEPGECADDENRDHHRGTFS